MIIFARSIIVRARYRCAVQIVDELFPFGAGSILLLILARVRLEQPIEIAPQLRQCVLALAYVFGDRGGPAGTAWPIVIGWLWATGVKIVCARYKRSEEHTSELQSLRHLVCRLLLEKKKKNT